MVSSWVVGCFALQLPSGRSVTVLGPAGMLKVSTRIGLGGVETLEVVHDGFGQVELVVPDALDDALGQFIGAVVVVMRGIALRAGAGEGQVGLVRRRAPYRT